MATFLEKNKKKSALAALLLFIRTRKTVTALLLLVALASFLFVSPSNLILSFPGGARVAAGVAWIAGKVGVDVSRWGLGGGKRDYSDLLAAFRAAKEGGSKAGWSAFMRGGDADEARRRAGGTGSLGFVKGDAKDLESRVGNGDKLPKPGTVGGILNPDDAKNAEDGDAVALSEEDLLGGNGSGEGGGRGGLVKSAFAGGFGTGFGNGFGSGFGSGSGSVSGSVSSAGGSLSGGAFAASGFFGGAGGAASGKLSDVVKGGLDGLIKGQTAKGVQIQGAAKGQLSKARASAINARTGRGMVRTHTISGQRAFVQLAAGRGQASISVAPNCTPGSGCPGEFASTNTGAVYDGNMPDGTFTDIIVVPGIDDFETPNVPNTDIADQYIRDAEKMDADAQKCRELDEKYGPQERAYDQQQEALSNQFDAMGCGQGGCSKSKAKKCQRIGDQMKQLCRDSMTVRCQHVRECPLTAKNNCSAAECDGPARNKQKVYDTNDGVRSTTMDQGEESAECTYAKNSVIEARQAAQNALTAYRSATCDSLKASPAVADQAKYVATCFGPGGQVVNTCNNYARTLCQSSQACSGAQCTGSTDQCDLDDLSGIEDFISQ